jgi:hypothetical protein
VAQKAEFICGQAQGALSQLADYPPSASAFYLIN